MIEATNERDQIDDRIWQGRQPATIPDGFDVIVLCDKDRMDQYVPTYKGAIVYRCPMDDDTMTLRSQDTHSAILVAAQVAKDAMSGLRILVTCHQGLNRSGLVVALVLMHVHGWTGKQAIERVRTCRPGSLFNPAFAAYLESLP